MAARLATRKVDPVRRRMLTVLGDEARSNEKNVARADCEVGFPYYGFKLRDFDGIGFEWG
jgi:hypothetical protein